MKKLKTCSTASMHQQTKLIASAMAFVAILIASTAVFAQTGPWAPSMTSDAVASLFADEKPVAVMVVTPTDSASENELASAFRDGLYAFGIAVVETDAPLGAIKDLSDGDIWEKAQTSSPASSVFIVRIQSDSDPKRGLIKGKTKTGFAGLTVVAGQPATSWRTSAVVEPVVEKTEPKPTETTPPEKNENPVATSIVNNAEKAAAEQTKVAPDPNGIFLRRDADADRREESVFQTGQVASLDYTEFYSVVGRDDLADSYDSKRTLKTAVFIGSGTAMAVGIGILFVGIVGGGIQSAVDADRGNSTLPIIGGSMVGVGAVGILTAFLINQFPTTTDEDDAMIDAHNETQMR